MNLQRNPDVAEFLTSLRNNPQQPPSCPICGAAMELRPDGGRICALCSGCDFHAAVPKQS